LIPLPRQTLNPAVQKETARQDGLIEINESIDDVLFDRNAETIIKQDSLTTPEFQKELQSIICACNNLNYGITWKEVITMIAEFHMVSHKKAEDHYNYMFQSKMLPALKGGNWTVCAQATMTNCTATTTAKLLCNHANFIAALDDFSVSILTRPTLWLLRVLCGLLEIRTRRNKRKTQMIVERASPLFVLALLLVQKDLAYSLQRERSWRPIQALSQIVLQGVTIHLLGVMSSWLPQHIWLMRLGLKWLKES
jgi:hypothetical protein